GRLSATRLDGVNTEVFVAPASRARAGLILNRVGAGLSLLVVARLVQVLSRIGRGPCRVPRET
ncbi:MAG TPA: hypothetical protein VKS44_00485, partial [Candidatus Acidoferrales bacterium]|nr:hypothetical protein [Candidatus Acidoferrales bacterium]